MIAGLREALRTEADRAPAYAVYERAMRTARRRRRNRLSAFAAAAAVLVLLALTALPAGMAAIESPPPAASGSDPSLPDRLAFPPAFWPGVTGDPPGPASVVFGGQGFAPDRPRRLLENEGDFAVVGATSDVYRMLRVEGYEAHAGEDVLLSPDGRQLAIPSGMDGPALIDLSTGRQTKLKAFTDNDYVTPMAWSPDGRTLAVEVVAGEYAWIGLVDVPDGSLRNMSQVDRSSYERGFDVAFSPDGLRWAYQDDGYLVIASREPKLLERVPIEGGWLAGKGAFAPDGSIVTLRVVNQRWQLSGSRQWTVGGLDLAAVRLIGWTNGQPVVVVYTKESNAPATDRPMTAYQVVHSIEVWRLTDSGHEVLLTAPHNLMSIDIADSVLASGRIRAADPPTTGIVTVFVAALPVVLVAVLIWRLRRRRLSSGRTRSGAGR